MSNIKQRLHGNNRFEGRLGTRVEYVDRSGQQVKPSTILKPYSRVNPKENGEKKPRRRPLPIKKSGAMFGGLDPVPTDPSIDPPPRACFNCWQFDHSRKKCPRPQVSRFCNNCGRRGEDLISCPRCARAHKNYVEQLKAKERGDTIDPEDDLEQLFPAASEDEDNACDEVLQELIFQDQKARELLIMQQKRERGPTHQERKIGAVVYEAWNREPTYEDERVNSRDVQHEHMGRSIYEERQGYVDYHDQEREKLRAIEREREIERERLKDRERRELERELELQREKEQRQMRSMRDYENGRMQADIPNNAGKHNIPSNPSSSNQAVDPVHEFLELAKSISHLSPETQEMVMRQVIAERKEQARLKAAAEIDDSWP